MLVRALEVRGFRNLAPLVLEPGSGFNVVIGDNGQGKTNLLEAIYFAGTLRSVRTTHATATVVRPTANTTRLVSGSQLSRRSRGDAS